MSYNRKNNDNLNIKEHLDASLDIKGITVSDELISKTLAAIKSNAEKVNSDKDSKEKKAVSWNRYVRGFASAAAVVLIVAAGYAMLHNLHTGKNKTGNIEEKSNMLSDSSNQKETVQDYTPYDDTEETEDEAAKKSADVNGAAYFDSSASGADNSDVTDTEMNKLQSFVFTTEASPEAAYSIGDIFIPEPELVVSLTINDADANSVNLTDKEEILDFYNLMDKYQYLDSTVSAQKESRSFIIEAYQQNDEKYTMTIGSNIIVEYGLDGSSDRKVYEASDMILLLDDLRELFDKYRQ